MWGQKVSFQTKLWAELFLAICNCASKFGFGICVFHVLKHFMKIFIFHHFILGTNIFILTNSFVVFLKKWFLNPFWGLRNFLHISSYARVLFKWNIWVFRLLPKLFRVHILLKGEFCWLIFVWRIQCNF